MPRSDALLSTAIGLAVVGAGLTGWVVGPALALAGAVALIAAFWLWRLDIAWTFSLAVGAYVFTGHADLIGFPFDPARALLALGFGRLAFERLYLGAHRREGRFTNAELFRQWWLWAAFAYVIGSAVVAGTLTDRDSLFVLLDQYGIVPFGLYLVAGTVFGTASQRQILLGVLSVVSAYIAVTGVMEGVGLDQFTLPAYIHDPGVGIHFGRARGPFVASVPMGIALTMGMLVALLLLSQAPADRVRWFSYTLGVASALGLVFTLTRGSWIAGVFGMALAMALLPRFRAYIPTALGTTAVGVAILLAAAPSISDRVTSRTDDLNPVWERANTNAAALRIIDANPAFGIGWARYTDVGNEYLRQPRDIPLRGAGVAVHNIFLLTLSEMGIIGATLWFGAFAICLIAPALRRGPPAREPWRAATLGLIGCCFTSALFAPQFGPYPAVLMWTLGGVVAHGRFSASPDEGVTSDQEADDEPSPKPAALPHSSRLP